MYVFKINCIFGHCEISLQVNLFFFLVGNWSSGSFPFARKRHPHHDSPPHTLVTSLWGKLSLLFPFISFLRCSWSESVMETAPAAADRSGSGSFKWDSVWWSSLSESLQSSALISHSACRRLLWVLGPGWPICDLRRGGLNMNVNDVSEKTGKVSNVGICVWNSLKPVDYLPLHFTL